ncbi:hypothetical protein [Algisphaera agarilytica]|uniref:Uncharacterized protein n=1 Tax=Algisphaera agarilytica TaxID=1385975 RepID=A0A7X0H4J2_9BACT|nr:hypothetical protein [Algisphaera agarilytica]MBB6428938.1 hypothetical protein [Algisphaera agarilytica]
MLPISDTTLIRVVLGGFLFVNLAITFIIHLRPDLLEKAGGAFAKKLLGDEAEVKESSINYGFTWFLNFILIGLLIAFEWKLKHLLPRS